jgi:CubicO group peptidase (beta-lactamase class C family)
MRIRTVIIALVSVAILTLLAIVLIPRLNQPKQPAGVIYWPTEGWRTATPEEQGFDSEKLVALLQAIQSQHIKIDSLLIIRDGAVVLDASFYPYDGDFPHNLASVTKSFTTTLIGIAEGKGLIDLDQTVLSFFPDRAIANLDARKEQVTVRHLASNVNGYSSGCLQGDEATLNAMRDDPDWVQSALDRKMIAEPGTHFCYDSPGMHLLSAILQQATGITELEFARQNLLEPLGITDVAWESDPQGYTHGWGDLHLLPRDAAKLGYLFLHSGAWDGQQIVPADWVQEAVKAQHETGSSDDYGYGWWVSEDGYHAMGRGGQYIVVYPQVDIILVATGAGFSIGQIEHYLVDSFTSQDEPLPANPDGVARLEAMVKIMGDGPFAQPSGPLPEMAKAISGKTYVFEPNPLNLQALSLDFSDPAQAVLHIVSFEDGELLTWPVGLDGHYRLTEQGRALRGMWEDPQTFNFMTFDIGQQTYRLRFDQDRVTIDTPDSGLIVEGRVAIP